MLGTRKRTTVRRQREMRLVRLGHGFGVYRRADGRYIAKYRDQADIARAPAYERAAEANTRVTEAFRVWPGRRGPVGSLSIAAMVGDYLEDREAHYRDGELAHNTIVTDRAGAKRVIADLGTASAIDPRIRARLAQWVESLRTSGLAPRTVSMYAGVLRGAYRRAIELGQIAEMAPVPRVPVRYRRVGQAIGPEGLRAMIEAHPDLYRPFVTTLAFSGMRIEEVCRLDIADFDPRRSTLAGGGKTEEAKSRRVAIPEWLTRELVKHLGDRTEGPLFLNRRGNRIDPDSYRGRIWAKAKVEAGYPDATPHWLRHTLATMLAESGRGVYELRSHFGWSDSRIADHYVKLAEHGVRAVAESLEGYGPVA
jgi:integrase